MYLSSFRERVDAFFNAEVQVFCQVLGVLYIYDGMNTAWIRPFPYRYITYLLHNDARTACYRIISALNVLCD